MAAIVVISASVHRSTTVLALTGGVPDSLGGALAWIVGLVALFVPLSVPLSVGRYRRMS
jgi:hypothetical protein